MSILSSRWHYIDANEHGLGHIAEPHRPGKISVDNLSFSEQARTGMADESLGVAAVRLQHFERLVPGHVGDLD